MSSEESGNGFNARIHCMDTVGSVMDEAFRLIREERFPVWDSAQANMQTAGKGQMGRKWVSLPGNILTAVRLPDRPPFNGSGAAIAIAALCAAGLRDFGFPVYIKWPNDLVTFQNDQIRKAGGILVEDRPGGIVAGIGINLAASPGKTELDHTGGLAPGALDAKKPDAPDKWEFWRLLVKYIHSVYTHDPAFETVWNNLADGLLLWRSLKVKVTDGDRIKYGQLIGVASNGAALLRTPGGVEEITHGEMSLEDMDGEADAD